MKGMHLKIASKNDHMIARDSKFYALLKIYKRQYEAQIYAPDVVSADTADMSLLCVILAVLRCIPFIGAFFKEDYESLYPVTQKPLKTIRKVAVIGYGVGGASTAYFLRELLGDSVELHVFSDGKVGGRTGVTEFSGNTFEAGASIIHKKNRYMSSLSAKFGNVYKLILLHIKCLYHTSRRLEEGRIA